MRSWNRSPMVGSAPYKKRKRGQRALSTTWGQEKVASESQEERYCQEMNELTPWSWTSRLQNHEKQTCAVSATQPMVICSINSTPGWLMCEQKKKSYTHYLFPESKSHSVVSDSLWPHGLYSPWNSPSQNTGVGSLSLLQGIFATQGWNPGLLCCGWILYQLSHKGSTRILDWVAYPFSKNDKDGWLLA